MTDPFRDLPQFPGEQAGTRPEPPDSAADRVAHAIPALVMVAGAAVGLLVVIGLAVLVVVRGVERGWLMPVLILAAFLALTVVAVTAALYQRAKLRRERME
jgi:ABC-type phosphate transport system auxiliary subunit